MPKGVVRRLDQVFNFFSRETERIEGVHLVAQPKVIKRKSNGGIRDHTS